MILSKKIVGFRIEKVSISPPSVKTKLISPSTKYKSPHSVVYYIKPKIMSKAIYLLLALFFVTTTLSATNSHGPWETKNPFTSNGLEQLNRSMQTTLRLSPNQLQAIRQTNRRFWEERQAILEQPGKVGRHTALLAAWDRWARNLQTILDKYQYKAFLEWQYEVSPLSERPY